MKLFLPPSRYTAHRIACIALYRALLEQCPRVQHLADGWPSAPLTFKHLIRKQFRRNQHVESPRLLVPALKAGYEAEEMLREAGDGDETSIAKITTILQEIERTRALSRENANVRPSDPSKKRRLPAPYPGAKPVLESRPRPLSELGGSGIRKAPVFVNAGLIPMLRFSKTHSPYLSRVLKQKQRWLPVIHDRMNGQEGMMKLCAEEDSWDVLVHRLSLEEAEVERGIWKQESYERVKGLEEGMGASWKQEVHDQLRRDRVAVTAFERKNRDVARRMLEIVEEEEGLVARERMDRKRARKMERMEMGDGERMDTREIDRKGVRRKSRIPR